MAYRDRLAVIIGADAILRMQFVADILAALGKPSSTGMDVVNMLEQKTTYNHSPSTTDPDFSLTGSTVASTAVHYAYWILGPITSATISLGDRFFSGDLVYSLAAARPNSSPQILGDRATIIGHEGIHALTGRSDKALLFAAIAKGYFTARYYGYTSAQASENFSKVMYSKCK